jgi:excisionase family DNA binding protein
VDQEVRLSRGRPIDHAPQGRVTVREAAQILGVSESAVRGRIERGTLPAKEVPLSSGERRYYLPRSMVEEEAVKLLDQEADTPDEAHIIIHNAKTSQRVRVETGPESTEIHLGE